MRTTKFLVCFVSMWIVGILMLGTASSQTFQVTQQALTRFVPGSAEPITNFYSAADAALRRSASAVGSFVPQGSICTGTWIGPYTVMTAAHCGDVRGALAANMFMESYFGGVLRNPEGFYHYHCARMLATAWFISNADFALWECQPTGGDTVPGGLRFGYAAYDASTLAGVKDVYSVWRNFVEEAPKGSRPKGENWGEVHIYSPGQLRSHSLLAEDWAGPNAYNCVAGGDRKPVAGPIARLDVASEPGASGSSHFDAVTHNIVVGPLQGGTPRHAAPIASLLGRNVLEGEHAFVETFITSADPLPGKRIPMRVGWHDGTKQQSVLIRDCADVTTMTNLAKADANTNFVFDVQEEGVATYEGLHGIRLFDFDDRLERVRWQQDGQAVRASKTAPPARPVSLGGASKGALPPRPTNEALILRGGPVKREGSNLSRGTYIVTVTMSPLQPDAPNLTLGVLCDSGNKYHRLAYPFKISPPEVVRVSSVLPISVPCDDPDLVLRAVGGDSLVYSVSFVGLTSQFDFENMWQRDMWSGIASPYAYFDADGIHKTRLDQRRNQYALRIDGSTHAVLSEAVLVPAFRYQVTFEVRATDNDAELTVWTTDGRWMKQLTIDHSDYRSYTVALPVFYEHGVSLGFSAGVNRMLVDNVSLETR